MTENSRDLEPPKELKKHVESAWLFDVDGVITDPKEKKILDDRMIDELARRLERDEPVTFNTGRDLGFVQKNVIEELIKRVGKDKLKNLFAVAEKGALWAQFSDTGMEQEKIDESISVPVELQERIRELVKNEFSSTMFYDESKKTMISVEMHDGRNLEEFKNKQGELNKKMQGILDEFGLSLDYKIEPNIIATDIQSIKVGKDMGAKRVLDWLASRGVSVETFYCYGDSISDMAVSDEIHSQGQNVEFVYVGEGDCLDPSDSEYPVSCLNNAYTNGTLANLMYRK